MAEHFVAADVIQALPQALDQVHLLMMDFFESLFLHILDAGSQTGDAEDVWRAAFEEVGIIARLRFAGAFAAAAAFAPGADNGAGADVERAGAGRTQKRLVARKCE